MSRSMQRLLPVLASTACCRRSLVRAAARSASPAHAGKALRGADAASVVAKGEYLARAGDCIACHTARKARCSPADCR